MLIFSDDTLLHLNKSGADLCEHNALQLSLEVGGCKCEVDEVNYGLHLRQEVWRVGTRCDVQAEIRRVLHVC